MMRIPSDFYYIDYPGYTKSRTWVTYVKQRLTFNTKDPYPFFPIHSKDNDVWLNDVWVVYFVEG